MLVCSSVLVVLLLGLPASPRSATRPSASLHEAVTVARAGAVPVDAADATFGGIVRALPKDFYRLASRDTLVTLVTAGVGAAAVRSEDADISADARHSVTFDRLGEGGGTVGSGYVQIGAAGALFVAGRFTTHTRLAAVGADLLEAQAVNAALTETIKLTVDRRRPDGGRYSFPSGHTSATFTTAAVLARDFGWKAAVPAYAMAAYVGGSRVQQQRHYLSDVIFGAGVGVVSGRTVQVRAGHHRYQLAPVVVPRGAAFWLTSSR